MVDKILLLQSLQVFNTPYMKKSGYLALLAAALKVGIVHAPAAGCRMIYRPGSLLWTCSR